MRFVVVNRLGRRGEGLGNEAIGWCKGFLAAQQLEATLVGPGWGLNRRRYYRNFRSSRLDFIAPEILKRLPHHSFTETDYRATGEVEFEKAIQRWATTKNLLRRSSFILTVDGMYGGYPAIRNARSFLWNQLLSSKDALPNIFEGTTGQDARKLSVAVHIRRGDFQALSAGDSARGKFNVRIPGAWYLRACNALQEAFGQRISFHFFTDHGGPEFEEMVRRFHPGQPRSRGLAECSDLALMAMADLRICSVSSYSLTACFLSDGPYLWYEPQLLSHDDCYSLWGKDREGRETENFRSARARVSGLPDEELRSSIVGWPWTGEAEFPLGLLERLKSRLRIKESSANLLTYGVVPHDAVMSASA